MSAILDWVGQIQEDREAAGDPNDTGPRAEIVRKGCDWAASKGGFISGAPWVQATCRPYWDDDPGYPPPGEPAPPFEGGQCDVVYRLRNATTLPDGTLNTPNGVARQGPITGVTITGSVDASNPTAPDQRQYFVRWTGAFGVLEQSSVSSAPPVFFVVRNDGLADDCGDPDDVQPAPVDVPSLPPDGEPIDVSPPGWTGPPITITFPPGQPDEPTYVEIDTTFGGGGNIFGPPESGNPDPPVEPLPPGEGDDAADGEPTGDIEQPELENVIGYTWQFPSIPANRGGVAGKNPSTFFEALGTIQLKLRSPDGLNYYSSQYVVRESRGAIVRDDPELDVVGVSWAFKPSFGVVQIRPLIAESE